MALSYATYPGNGTDIFSIEFPYLARKHVQVFVDMNDGTGAQKVIFEFLTNTSIKLAEAAPNGSTVHIKRVTPIDMRVVDYEDGSTLGGDDLDRQSDQLLFMTQEAYDSLTEQIQINNSGKFDAIGKILTNLAEPSAPTDAVTKNYVDSGVLAPAKAARDAAIVARIGAETAQGNAKIAESGAKAAQVASEAARDATILVKQYAETACDAATAAQEGAEQALTKALTAKGKVIAEGDTQVARVSAEGDAWVDQMDFADEAVAVAGTDSTKVMSALMTAKAIVALGGVKFQTVEFLEDTTWTADKNYLAFIICQGGGAGGTSGGAGSSSSSGIGTKAISGSWGNGGCAGLTGVVVTHLAKGSEHIITIGRGGDTAQTGGTTSFGNIITTPGGSSSSAPFSTTAPIILAVSTPRNCEGSGARGGDTLLGGKGANGGAISNGSGYAGQTATSPGAGGGGGGGGRGRGRNGGAGGKGANGIVMLLLLEVL